jgi:hypothetical protein
MKLTYQSPKMFKWAGVYLTIWGKRYCVFKLGDAWKNPRNFE